MEDILFSYLSQLASQVPVLFVYSIGMILSLVFWSRCPGPCTLTLLAMGLLLALSLLQPMVFLYVVRVAADSGWDAKTQGWMFSINAIVGSFLRAAAVGLLLTAVFTGRQALPPTNPDTAFKPVA